MCGFCIQTHDVMIYADIGLVSSSSSPPSGPCQHGQRDVFRPARSRRLRHLLQPAGRPRALLHHRLQLLRGDARRDVSRHAEGHPVPAAGAPSAPLVEPLPSRTSSSTPGKETLYFPKFWRGSFFYMNVFVTLHQSGETWYHVEDWM